MKKFYPQLRSIQIKTGIWTLVISLILVLGYLWLTNRLAMSSSYEVKIAFSDVMGLEIGDKVMFRGMEVGRIKSIKADGDAIITTAKINTEIKLKEGSRFTVTDSSLMGGKALMITQGDADGWLDTTKLQQGASPEGIMNVIGKASETLGELNAAISLLKEPDGLLQRTNNLVGSADVAVQNAGQMAKDVKSELSLTLAKVDRLTASINEVLEENKASLKNSLDESPAVLAKISGTLDSLQFLSANLNKTVQSLNSSDGTAGKLINDKQLYDQLSSSVQNLELLLKDIKANPKKYVKFSLF
jgi:phospholipid/cholesterol/gamma-HCH transport system substrate-binding protein